MTSLDITALAVYCTAFARHVEAEAMLQGPGGYCPNCDPREGQGATGELGNCILERESHLAPQYGMIVRNRIGTGKREGTSPFVALNKEALSQMRQFMSEFGMTPASRSRLPKGAKRRRPEPPNETDGEKHRGEAPDPRKAFEWSVQAAKN